MNSHVIRTTDSLWLQVLQKLDHDIYHLPKYVYLESVRTKTRPEAILIEEDGKFFFIPYLLRVCDCTSHIISGSENVFDAISPYGYPGLLLNKLAINCPKFITSAMNQFVSILRAKNVCSAFLRLHPILNNSLDKILSTNVCQTTGTTVSIDLKLSSEEIWKQTKPGHRNKINRCKRRKLVPKIVDLKDNIGEFIDIYKETMDRVGARKNYYFSNFYFSYFATELAEVTHLAVVKSKDNEICCAGLFTECDGIVQYHLGGTRNKYLKEAPSKLMFDYIRYWAKERGNKILHLGGGLGGSENDNLFRFKAGFSPQRHTFLTIRLITEEKKYLALTDSQAKLLNISSEELLSSSFFPAYRYSDNG